MATDYTLTLKEREQTKVHYSDLAPSLQEIIDGKVDQTLVDDLNKKLTDYEKAINGMVLTAGTSFPSNPTNNKNVHLNLTNRVLYVYTSSTWKPAVMIPQD